ncbi:MAG TPA: hypothetical protein VFH27_08705 [Longimicrobiaceae bacterium]|nr:hypothetical protein [Longimicrobiaceae bacterium]
MSAHWIYTVPLWLLAILLVVGVNGLALGGVLLARRRRWTVSPDDNTAAGYLHALMGVVYAVALGLIVVMVQGDYGDVDEAAVREASAVGDLYRLMDGLSEPARSQLRLEVRQYVDSVVTSEWPAVAAGGRSAVTARQIDELARHIIRFVPAAPHDNDIYPVVLETLQSVLDNRRERILQGVEGIGGVTWMVIILGGLITLGFACTFHMRSARAQVVLTGLMGTSFALMIFLIIAMDHPLWGDLSIAPDAMQQVRTAIRLQELEAAAPGGAVIVPHAPLHRAP